jgi:hypothetical protein
MKNLIKRTYEFLRSSRFFKFIFLFFIFESVWIAFSAAYPQAFDENFHFGIIQVYSHYWLPFLSSQPAGASAYGAVARDPSYLYHYLMSFPYRFIALFLHTQIEQVIALRLINVGLLGSGLILSRRVLLRVGISAALANMTILVFVLIPIVPQLAAQINYDNLFIPLTAWAILLTFNVTDQLRARQPSIKSIIGLLSLCLLTGLVKYAFLPIFAGIIVFLIIVAFKAYRHKLRLLGSQLMRSWFTQPHYMKVVLLMIGVISIGMFVQRDGVNLIDYHSLEPNCSSILSVHACEAYSPWDYNYTQHNYLLSVKSTTSFMNPVFYTFNWIYWMWYRLFFAVNGPAQDFANYPPLPLPAAAAIVLAFGGAIATFKWRHKIFKGNINLILLL